MLSPVHTWLGLVLGVVSPLVVNGAYPRGAAPVNTLPTLSLRHPRRTVHVLVTDRQWLIGFGTESAGWLVYLAALRLAPIALVQAVSASGIAVLAWVTAGGDPRRLTRREQAAV